MIETTSKPQAQRVWKTAALPLAIAVPVLFAIHPIFLDDLFFALAGGRWIVEHGQIPRLDPFSWSRAGEPWINYTWLFNVAVYSLHQLVGLHGLTLCFAALTGLIFWLMSRLCRALGLGTTATAALVLLAAVMARGRLQFYRPEFVTLLGGVLTLLILEFPEKKFLGFSALGVLPPMLWVWSNAHGGFPVGLVLPLIYAADAALRRDGERAQKILVTLGVSLLACVANPYGAAMLLNVAWHWEEGAARALLVEWQPLLGTSFAADRMLIRLFQMVFALGLLGFLLNWRQSNWARFGSFLALAFLAWQGRRFVSLFGLMALPLAAAQWREIGMRRCAEDVAGRRPWTVGTARLAALAALLVALADGARRVGFGIDPLINPVAAIEHLKTHSPHELRLFNDLNFSAYQMWAWPQQRTFVDLRHVLFGDAFMRDTIEGLLGGDGWQRLNAHYRFHVVLIGSHNDGNAGLIRTLANDPQWKRVYFDATAVAFARSEIADAFGVGGVANPTDRDEVRRWRELAEVSLRPRDRARLRVQWAQALYEVGAKESARAELEDWLASGARSYDALRLLAVLALEAGDGTQLQVLLSQMLRLDPSRPEAYWLAAHALRASGNIATALQEISRVTAANPNDVGALLFEAELAEQLGQLERAERLLRRAVKLYPLPRPDPYLRLAMAQEKRGDLSGALASYRRALALWNAPNEEFRQVQQHTLRLQRRLKAMP